MKKILCNLFILLVLLMPNISLAQYYSVEFNNAVSSGTRTNTGYPGKMYKNNFVDYKISASFNTSTHLLEGEEVVTVYNNNIIEVWSCIYFNLYRNIYKKGVPRIRECNPSDITDEGMEILEVVCLEKGKEQKLTWDIENTKMKVTLPHTVKNDEKVTLRVKWQNKIAANTHHRGGLYYDNSWFVPYWYPQVAVCDDLYGWDLINHSGNEEFLFEFADYDVSIKLNDGLIAWATGDLVNSKEIFSPEVYSKYQKAKSSDVMVDIILPEKAQNSLRNASNEWHFKATNVPDFVFACSKEMGWAGMSTPILNGQPRTFVSTIYKNENFKTVASCVKNTLEYLSTKRPGVPYPYSHMSVFQGSGGMEFPMMINEDFDNSFDSDFFTTSHEVTHSYFPFITGMYQNRFAFMDEGLTQFVPQYFQQENFKWMDIMWSAAKYTGYVAQTDDNVPIMTPSYSQTNLSVYTVNSYYKPQVMYTALEDIVGKDTMDMILHEFVVTWAGKHPHPFDFFNLCSTLSGKDLKEFFHSWVYTTDYPDLSVSLVGDKSIKVSNLGGLMLPVQLDVKLDKDLYKKVKYDALVWSGGKKELILDFPAKILSVELGDLWIPDVNKNNNTIK